MTNTYFKSLLLSFCMLLVGFTASAEEKKAEEKQPIRAEQLSYYGPIVVRQPVLSDSTNVMGKAYDMNSMLQFFPYNNENHSNFTEITPGNDYIFTVQSPAVEEETDRLFHFFKLNILPATYGKGDLQIESTAPFEVYMDGKKVMSGRGAKAIADSIKPQTKQITLTPTRHNIAIRVTLQQKDSLENISLRAGYVPAKEDADVELRVDNKYYPDLPYMLYGKSLASTTISPSGTYSTLSSRSVVDGKSRYHSVLYKNGQRVGEFDGAAASARWMPKQDKLYYTEKSETGRTLYLYDPETMDRTVLHPNIPDGSFSMSPGETGLIYFTSDKGPKYKKTLDLFTSPQERVGGFRNRTFLSFFDFASGTLKPLTFGNRSTRMNDMNKDDSKLIFSVSTTIPTVSPFYRTDFYELDMKDMSIDTLFTNPKGISSVEYASDEDYFVVSGSADAFNEIGSLLPKGDPVNTYDTQLFLFNRKNKSVKPLTKEFDRTISSFSVPANRFEVYFSAEVGDRKLLYKCDLKSGKIEQLSKSEDYVKRFAVANYAPQLTYIGQSGMTSDRFYMVDTKRNRETLVYDLSATKMKDMDPGTMKDWDYTAPDGTVVQGRYYLPPNFDPNKKYPMIVYYYGGTSPVNRVFEGTYSLPMYAALGYVVYSMNPSGSTGYGQEFAARHINAWGKRTADEIIGSVKAFCATHPFVDSSKIGCMGASYGGFMTQYLQTQTDIFAAAVSHAGISAISSYWGEGYWGVGYSTVASTNSYPWNNPDLYVNQSPLFLADKINTPILLVHGLADTNVPVGESWQMFNALQILGKEVAFIGVYDQDHHIIDLKKRYEWSSAIMAWFAKYLQDDSTWWDDLFPENNL